MKKLACFIIASVVTSTTFALPIYKEYPAPQAFTSQEHPVELNDFSGEWVGSCTKGNEGEPSKKIRLTITQNPKQITLMFNHHKKEVIVLNLNQLSSQTSNTFNKREAIIQRVLVLDSNAVLFNYASIAQQGTSEEDSSLITIYYNGILAMNENTLPLPEPPNSSHGPCVVGSCSINFLNASVRVKLGIPLVILSNCRIDIFLQRGYSGKYLPIESSKLTLCVSCNCNKVAAIKVFVMLPIPNKL